MNQSEFAAALLDPNCPQPAGLITPDGGPAPKRFAVYRNNVAVSLTEVLRAAFPAIERLVGAAFFAAMAGEFLRRHPPRSRIMMLYGDEFAGFLSGFAPVAAYPYLPDVARLEQAMRESYHAADNIAVPPAILAATPEATWLSSRLTLAPALRLISSPWPIHAIWQANLDDGPDPVMRAEDVLILRPEFDPRPHLLPKGAALLISALQNRATVAEALSQAGPNLDLSATLTLLMGGGAITGLHK